MRVVTDHFTLQRYGFLPKFVRFRLLHFVLESTLIRQYIPKDMDFKDINNQQVKQYQYKLNKKPREKIDSNFPLIAFTKHLK